jgi:PKD repeat protein
MKEPPVSIFAADPISGTAPLTVTFTDLGTGQPTNWAWDFGDGTTSTEQHPTHTYTAAGHYTVSLTVSNPLGSNTRIVPECVIVTEAGGKIYLPLIFKNQE